MDIYYIIYCPEIGDFMVCKKEEIEKEHNKNAKYINNKAHFAFYDQNEDGSIYIYDQSITENDIVLIKDDKSILQEVEIYIFISQKDWSSLHEVAHFKGTIHEGLLWLLNNKKDL